MRRLFVFGGGVLLATAISLAYQLLFGFARATNGVFELFLLLLTLCGMLWWLGSGATDAQRRAFRLVSPAPRTRWLMVAYPLFTLFEMCAESIAGGGTMATTSRPSVATTFIGVTIAASAAGLLYAVLVGPLLEEIVSRGFLLEQLRRAVGSWVAVVVSAAVFALLHVDLPRFPMLFLTGLAYGYTTLRAGSLGLTMVLHVAHNLTNHVLESAGLSGTRIEWLHRTPAVGIPVTLTLGVLTAWHLARLQPITPVAGSPGRSGNGELAPRSPRLS
jgi:membrane protease YdiL (CAAX protease family)